MRDGLGLAAAFVAREERSEGAHPASITDSVWGDRRIWHTSGAVLLKGFEKGTLGMAPISGVGSLDEIRRRVIRELVDLEIVSARRLTRRYRFVRGVRRRGRRLTRLGR